MNYQLVAALLKNKWYMGIEHAMNYGPIVSGVLAGHDVEFSLNNRIEKDNENFTQIVKTGEVTYFHAHWRTQFENMPFGSVAVVSLNGPLMKNDQYCGPVGMATVGEIIKKASASKNVSAILLHVDSPGGTVDGTKDLADIVASVEKPVVAFADGLMASAAMWIGSAADEIWASQDHAEIGSVGVMLSFADMQPAWEKLGVKFHTIVAPQSKDKNKDFMQLKEGKYEDYENNVLAPLAQEFIDTIKNNRPGVKDEHLTGKVFFAKDVRGSFIDEIGSFDEAVRRASKLAAVSAPEGEHKSANNLNQNKTEMKVFKNINSVLAVDSLESVDEHVALNEEQLEAIDTALEANAGLQTQLTEVTTARDNVTGELATANATIAEHLATIETLKTGAGADPSKVIKTGGKDDETEKAVQSAHDLFDMLPE